MKPITRYEMYLANMNGESIDIPDPITRVEMYLARLCGMNNNIPKPITREEMFLAYLCGEVITPPEAITRLEMFMASAAGIGDKPTPITRKEMLWNGVESVEEVTISGNPLTFKTDISRALKKAKVTFSPHQEGSGDPSPDNIRPITGRTGVVVEQSGKNLMRTSLAEIKAVNTSGTWSGNTYTRSGISFTPQLDDDGNITGILANGTASGTGLLWMQGQMTNLSNMDLILSGCPSGGNSTTYNMRVYRTGDISIAIDIGNGIAFNNADLNTRIGIIIANGVTVSNMLFKPMIRLASDTDSAYVSPTSQHRAITWETEAGEVFGGYIDAVKGKLVAEWAIKDGGDVSWDSVGSEKPHLALSGIGTFPNILLPSALTVVGEAISNKYGIKSYTGNDGIYSRTGDGAYFSVTTSGRVGVYDSNIDFSTMTSAEIKTYLTGTQFCYKLATSIEYNIDAVEIKSLLGDNVMWSDADNLEVTYVKKATS